MTDIDSYAAGTPCWVDLMTDDQEAALAFYGPLFGWEFERSGPEYGGYATALVRGRSVAGVGVTPEGAGFPPVWTTYMATPDADATAEAIAKAGGTVFMPPTTVGDLGRMAVAGDPTGGAFGLWQPGVHPGAQLVNEPGALTWNELASHDAAASRAFFAEVLGWDYEQIGDGESFDYTTVLLGGQPVGGIMQIGEGWPPGAPSAWTTYFAVADTDATLQRVRELGGTVVGDAQDSPFGRLAPVADPQGGAFRVITLPVAGS